MPLTATFPATRRPNLLYLLSARLTSTPQRVSVRALRLVLVIFALWVLVVEPTFRAFELMEQHSSECAGGGGGEVVGDADQLIPPSEVIAPSWVNQHLPLALALPLADLAGFASSLHLAAPAIAASPLSAELWLPYPPSAQPLRL